MAKNSLPGSALNRRDLKEHAESLADAYERNQNRQNLLERGKQNQVDALVARAEDTEIER
jgi:hypothetical protein